MGSGCSAERGTAPPAEITVPHPGGASINSPAQPPERFTPAGPIASNGSVWTFPEFAAMDGSNSQEASLNRDPDGSNSQETGLRPVGSQLDACLKEASLNRDPDEKQVPELTQGESELVGVQAGGKVASPSAPRTDRRGSTLARVKASDVSPSASLATDGIVLDKKDVPFAPAVPQPLDASLSCLSLHIEPSVAGKKNAERHASGFVSPVDSSLDASFLSVPAGAPQAGEAPFAPALPPQPGSTVSSVASLHLAPSLASKHGVPIGKYTVT